MGKVSSYGQELSLDAQCHCIRGATAPGLTVCSDKAMPRFAGDSVGVTCADKDTCLLVLLG